VTACQDTPLPTAAEPVVSTTTTTATPIARYTANNPEPVAALGSFLQAEVAGDVTASFEFLSAADQEAAGGSGGWAAEHVLVMPVIRGYRITNDALSESTVAVSAELSLEPSLDPLVGLTTAQADSRWILRAESGTWRIVLTESSIQPVYLNDGSAAQDVEGWVTELRNCQPATQWKGALLGFPILAGEICGARGEVVIGATSRLSDAAESAPFLAAFGPDVGQWARVVEVESPIRLRAVVAPIDDQWLVIGVLEASA
jgi:hypothetical protein